MIVPPEIVPTVGSVPFETAFDRETDVALLPMMAPASGDELEVVEEEKTCEIVPADATPAMPPIAALVFNDESDPLE